MPLVEIAPEAPGFRRTLGLFATGVGLVAVQSGTRIHGMTANAISSVSLDPLLVLVCLGKQTTLAGLLREVGSFSINFLTRDQERLARHFAGAAPAGPPVEPRFERWQCGPAVQGCLAVVGCRLEQLVSAGDHWIAIGRVAALAEHAIEAEPLVFYRGRYRLLRPEAEALPGMAPDTLDSTGASVYYGEWE